MKLKSIFYSLLIASLTSTAYAQVKIGSNPGTITSTSNLEVESSNGTKVVVDKATGNLGAGVTDPGQSIDAAGTARLRNIPTNVTNSLILTVDANGVVSKQNAQAASLPVITGILSTPAASVTIAADQQNYIYTGASITIPANSKYAVNVYMLLAPATFLPANTSTWIRSGFSDTISPITFTGDAVGSTLVSGIITGNSFYSPMIGVIILKNSSNSPKTYYYVAGGTSPVGSVSGIFFRAIGSSGFGENQIYAVPIN